MKRILSLLLAFTLLCSLLPTACITAYAANYTTSYNSFTAPDSSDMAYNGGKNSGTTTDEIKWMQAALNYCIQYKGLSATLLDVDGVFGAASAAATKAFQSKYGLTADGYFGSGTIAKMKSVLSGSTTSTTTKTTVTLNNQSATTVGTRSVTATYGSAMPSITVPTKTGYIFGGYYTATGGSGTQYYTASGTSARAWDKTSSTATLYAKWTASSTTTSYDTGYSSYTAPTSTDYAYNGGKNSTTTLSEVKWMQAALNYCIKYKGLNATPLVVDGDFGAASAAATTAFQNKYGLTADGWFGSGTIAKMKEVLGLSTTAQTTIITLDNRGATTAGTRSKTVTYGSAMPPISVPSKTNYTFGGYYSGTNGTGTQYYTSTGASARTWDKTTSTATLYAKWTATTTTKTTTITLNNQSATTAGTATVTATYGSAMPAITIPTKTGYTFGGYYTFASGIGTQYYTSSGTSARTWDKTGTTATLYAKWTASKTTMVTLNNQGATTAGTTSITATNGSPMPANITLPTKTGYTFGGYYDATNGMGTQYYTSSGSSARNWNKDVSTATLYAKWTAKTTSVTLDSQDATTVGTISVTATYGSSLESITIPTKTNYDFGGYYTSEDGKGTQYYNASGNGARTWDDPSTKVTLYAKWVKKTILDSSLFDQAAFALVAASVSAEKAASNLIHNEIFDAAIAERAYLVNQNDRSFFGGLLYGEDCTHDNVGCELIAMYNALKLTGYPVSYSGLTHKAETTSGAQLNRGVLGTNPYKLGDIMRTYGATVTEYSSALALDAAMKVGDIAVVSDWNNRNNLSGGVHTYAIEKTNIGLKWYNYRSWEATVLTSYTNSTIVKSTVYATLIKDNSAYIIGYIVK